MFISKVSKIFLAASISVDPTRDIYNSGIDSHLTVSSPFSSAPAVENIYAIRNKTGGTQEPKHYKVLGVSEDDAGFVDVVASFFFDRKLMQ